MGTIQERATLGCFAAIRTGRTSWRAGVVVEVNAAGRAITLRQCNGETRDASTRLTRVLPDIVGDDAEALAQQLGAGRVPLNAMRRACAQLLTDKGLRANDPKVARYAAEGAA